MRFLRFLLIVVLTLLIWPQTSEATFHEWKIDQVYSNASGSIQYVDFVLPSHDDNEQSLQFAQLKAGLNSNSMGFTNLPAEPVDGQHFLVATPGFAALAGVTPDYVFPVSPFFNPAGDTVNYGPNINTLTFGPFSDDILAASHNGNVLNSPTNFAGVVGFVPEPASGMLLLIGAGTLLAVARRRARLLSLERMAQTEQPDELAIEALGAAPRELTAADLRSPHRRRVWWPLILFIATCLSTFWVGTTDWEPHKYLGNMRESWAIVVKNWPLGLKYMAAVIGILVAHEMGHFVQTIRYGVAASWPIFLPLPIAPTGTMGAVIVMDPSKADRKQLFDIGIWGPWAGLIVAVPMIWYGIKTAVPDPTAGDFPFGTPLVFKLITAIARPELQSGAVMKNPWFMAGWVGMLVTGLNMLPVSQLDGGHVVYGLFGTHSRLIVRAFIIAAIGFIIITEQYNWVVMLVLVLMLGIDHPPTRDDSVPLGPVRWVFGLISLFIPVLCFTPLLIPGA